MVSVVFLTPGALLNRKHDAVTDDCITTQTAQTPTLVAGVFSVLIVVHPSRFERETCPLGGGRSIQLSYECEPEAAV